MAGSVERNVTRSRSSASVRCSKLCPRSAVPASRASPFPFPSSPTANSGSPSVSRANVTSRSDAGTGSPRSGGSSLELLDSPEQPAIANAPVVATA
ncbi:hypothetical protein BRC93_08150 [Halobacteriales archaeon QS_5_70_15]|nr:MAG: hypothetical protein BRC93_08150 [Halobacteriales archaeon QS_5_70_15]